MGGKRRNKKEPYMKCICKNCRTERPLDEKLSNENWRVYDTKSPCKECGLTEIMTVFEE